MLQKTVFFSQKNTIQKVFEFSLLYKRIITKGQLKTIEAVLKKGFCTVWECSECDINIH